MSNYTTLMCPVSFKVEAIFSKHYYDFEEDENLFKTLSDLALLVFCYEWDGRGCEQKYIPANINGWSFKFTEQANKYENHGMYVYAQELNKGNSKVWLINESEYADCEEVLLSVFSNNEEALLDFMADFKFYENIKSTTYVRQTV